MADRKDEQPRPLSEILETMRTSTELGKSLHEAKIWEQWPAIVGPVLMHHGMPLRVRDGVLTIAVSSSVWMHRMSYKKSEIVHKIDEILGPDHVRELFFTLAEEEAEKNAPKRP